MGNERFFGLSWQLAVVDFKLRNALLSITVILSLFFLGCTEDLQEENFTEGVVVYNKELAFDGYNVYHGIIMDMEGDIILNLTDIHIFEFLDDGSFLASKGPRSDRLLGRYTLSGKILWEKNLSVHHEVTSTSTGDILAVSREIIRYNNRDVTFDVVIILDKEGQEIDRWSTFENLNQIKEFHEPSFLDEPAPFFDSNCTKLARINSCYEYYHLNSIQELPPNPLEKIDSRFKHGNWLISLPFFDLVAIVDKDTKDVVWGWGKHEISRQHMPRMLHNGNILIFDNGKGSYEIQDGKIINDHSRIEIINNEKIWRFYSRIIELDPIKEEIVWEYKADPPERFFTGWGGTSQRLPNDNTLIMESMNGRAFEVTLDKEIVWEWINPEKNESGQSISFNRMIRIEKKIIS